MAITEQQGACPTSCDVLVVGSGNAACCAAISAIDAGATHVLMIDCAPPSEPGGNTYYTAGSMRTVFSSFKKDLCSLPLHNVTEDMVERIEMTPYSREDFLGDLTKVTGGRCDETMATMLVEESWEGIQWLAKRVGVRFRLPFERQAYEVEPRTDDPSKKRWRCWGGLYINTMGGGKGLVEDELKACKAAGVDIHWKTKAEELWLDKTAKDVKGLIVTTAGGQRQKIEARGGVVLACGGYESSKELRGQLMGPEWASAYVRGTPHNDGTALRLGAQVTALRKGQFGDGACHSTCWDAHAPRDRGDVSMTNQFTKSGYPLGIFVDSSGRRFVDEGEDLRNYTYAKMGQAILKRPDRLAVQIWDARTSGMLRDEEYADDFCQHKVHGETLEELAEKLAKVEIGDNRRALRDPQALLDEVRTYNEAIYRAREGQKAVAKGFEPSIKDGLVAPAPPLAVPKSNWALPIDKGPYLAVVVSTGVTFTFGGLHIDAQSGQVQRRREGQEGGADATEGILGLYAAGEAAGGLFWGNYPGGSGLTAGLVWGRRAGRAAAEAARKRE